MKIINIVLLILVTFQLISCGGAEGRKAAYLEKADKSIKAGDLDKARIELKNVLQIDPKDARAYFKLGYVFEQKREYNKAFGNYSKATELSPENPEYQAKLGRLYLLGGNVDKATEKMNLILNKNNNDENGLLLKAGILLKQNKMEEARHISEKLLKDHPENIDNVILLAEIFDFKKDYKNAIEVLRNSLKTNLDNQQLLSLLANALFLNKDYDGTEKILKNILTSHPDVLRNYTTLSTFYEKTGDTKKAEQVLRSAITANKDDVKPKLALIKFINKVNGSDTAISAIKSLIKDYPDESTLRLALAELYIQTKNMDGAIDTYKTTIKEFSEEEAGVTARVNLAKIYMQKNEVKDAVDYIAQAKTISPNDTDVNFTNARIAIFNKKYEEAITSLRTVIKNNPENIQAYLLLAASHKANNESKQADEILDNAYQNNRANPKALLQLIQFYLRDKDVAKAEKVNDGYLKLDPNNYNSLSIKADILNTKKNYADASITAEKIRSLYPNMENGYLLAVPAILEKKKLGDAIELLKNGYKNTGSGKVLKTMAQLQISNRRVDDAIATLKSIPVKDRDEEDEIILSAAYIVKKDTNSAIKVLQESINQDKTRVKSYLTLANIYKNLKKSDDVVSTLNKGIAANPDNMRMAASLAGYYELSGDLESAINVYNTILAINPDNLVANNNLAALLAEHKTDSESLKRAKELVAKLKDNNQPAIMDTVGWVYCKLGNYKDAINILNKVVTEQPDVQVFNYHLGMAYFNSGDKINAKKYLEKSVSVKNRFPGVDDARKTLKLL